MKREQNRRSIRLYDSVASPTVLMMLGLYKWIVLGIVIIIIVAVSLIYKAYRKDHPKDPANKDGHDT